MLCLPWLAVLESSWVTQQEAKRPKGKLVSSLQMRTRRHHHSYSQCMATRQEQLQRKRTPEHQLAHMASRAQGTGPRHKDIDNMEPGAHRSSNSAPSQDSDWKASSFLALRESPRNQLGPQQRIISLVTTTILPNNSWKQGKERMRLFPENATFRRKPKNI